MSKIMYYTEKFRGSATFSESIYRIDNVPAINFADTVKLEPSVKQSIFFLNVIVSFSVYEDVPFGCERKIVQRMNGRTFGVD